MERNVVIFLRTVFISSLTKLKPINLIQKNIKYNVLSKKLTVFDDDYDLKDRNVYVVGAGKAVLQMATEIEKILGNKMLSGIVSVPWGITNEYSVSSLSSLKCIEGAQNNTADEKSMLAARKIKELVSGLDTNALLLVLLSGGGSALLPDPIHPISLQEKSDFIKCLSLQGADIKELNTVRKKLSSLKGGKLALLAHPAEIVTLLVSDIVGVCPDMVASGPTFENNDHPDAALNIVQKYISIDKIPMSIFKTLTSNQAFNTTLWKELKVSNYVLGNNVCLVDYACCEAEKHGYNTYHISHVVAGNVLDVARDYCYLVCVVCDLLTKSVDQTKAENILKSLSYVPIHDNTLEGLLNVKLENKGVCLIAGGEPVVKVIGTGKGGRNQHLALQFSYFFNLERNNHPSCNMFNIYFLSGGTDGMDGPTDAAGAIGYDDLVDDASHQQLDVHQYLENNDSYSFFSKFMKGDCHIKIGHTNTNVMDLHMIVIELKNTNAL